MSNVWETPLRFVKGVGPARAEHLKSNLGLKSVGDLLTTFPRRLDDRSQLREIGSLQPGERVVIEGRVDRISTHRVRRLAITEARLVDDTGRVTAVWFNQPYLVKSIAAGDTLLVEGAVRQYRGLQIQVREYVRADRGDGFTGWVPLYPLTEGLTQKQFRALVRSAVDRFGGEFREILPEWALAHRKLMPRSDAIRALHFPEDSAAQERARRRLVYEELFALQASIAILKRRLESGRAAVPMRDWKGLRMRIQSRIPFKLTRAQQRAVDEILRDMSRPVPMNRLLQGDVGSGKTVVALAAALFAIGNRAQACVMAPTDILARQHFSNFERLLQGSRVKLALLTAGARRDAARDADLIVGTHALLERDVRFERLGLAIVDEQHKFGVAQRATLAAKARRPHTLVMTATPIPRTLALAVYGHLDLTVIDEMPPGRRPPRTLFRPVEKLPDVCSFISKKLREGRQAYFVYPIIDESEAMRQVRAASTMVGELQGRFRDARVELLHGRMKPEEKEAIMLDFRGNRIGVLVSTVVIEVGVDVPNASVMVIDHAERFGLSQLHQLRGRIGRGPQDSYCILMGRATTPEAQARFDAMLKTSDGFKIAEEDLKIRGPGELLGTRQSGLPPLKLADLVADAKILAEAREDARDFVERRPGLEALRGGPFLAELRIRFGQAAAVLRP